MSGLFGQLVGGLFGGQSGQPGQTSPIAGILQQVLTMSQGNQGGIAALVSRFQAAGLGEHAQSWVGTGENRPISADQVGQVFTPDELQGWAQQAGTTPEALQGILAQALPRVVDHLTPGGQVPSQTPNVAALVGRLFGG